MTTEPVPRVLLVDDDPLMVETLNLVLGATGFRCRTTSDGLGALKHLLEEPYDIIILDLRMPNMSGYELLEIIRQQFPQCRVFVISSANNITDKTPGLTMDAFFQKGAYTHDKLIATMRKLLTQSKKLAWKGARGSLPARGPDSQCGIADDAPTIWSKAELNGHEDERATVGSRIAIEDEGLGGFRVRGLYDPWERAWRIKTWPAGCGKPEHDYWLRGGELYAVRFPLPSIANHWQRGAVGARDIGIAPAERNAIFALVAKWELMAERSA